MSKKHYVFYPSPFRETPQDTSKILSDLGRPTKRGIKKCFKCGTYNGTRGLMCKNKQCDAVFKECGEKQTANLDAIKLISGISRHVFSVRVRDKGPDCRGFVQLPLMQGSTEAKEKNVALSEVALCFVDSCQRLFDDSILKCHETEPSKVSSICIHIKSALKSVTVATPIETKSCLLNSLNFSEEVKQKLWLLSETEGALVQRVSKTVMAVKCQVTPKHPLGYLHFTFCLTKGKTAYDKFYCSCLNFKGYRCVGDSFTMLNQKCIHFYACVWAFASDLKFTEEFIDFINVQLCVGNEFPVNDTSVINSNAVEQHYSKSTGANVQKTKYSSASNKQTQLYPTPQKPQIYAVSKQKSLELKLQRRKLKRKFAIKPNVSTIIKMYQPEKQISLSFIDWLTSITERINQALCYQQNEHTESLNFYVPVKFYELLVGRLQNSNKKSIYSYIISGATGTSYLIFSISYLKEVFDTPQVSLQIMEVFTQNQQGSFTKVPYQESDDMCRPLTDYKQVVVFLKVGTEKNYNSSVPFTINWTSNVLPISSCGKLELVFHIDCCEAEHFNKQFL